MLNCSRHSIFRGLLFILVIPFAACNQGKKTQSEKVEQNLKPNFLVIIADDAGWNDFSYHGSIIQTPTIDSLARSGTELNRFYVAPTCSPARAALLTGRPASRMGIVAPISGKSEKTLPDSIITLPQALGKEGYETAIFGKWHLGLTPSSGPKSYGFDYAYGFLHGQIDQYTHQYKNGDSSWYRNDQFITEEGHATDLITEEAIEWLDQQDSSSKSFYAQVAYSAPHFPLQEEDRWKQPYEKTIEDPSRRDYAAAMAHMDHSIGKLLNFLKKKGLDENTIVIFFSDNGAMENWIPTDQYDGKFEPNPVLGDNLPLRDWKTSNYEGAIRVPAIVSGSKYLAEEISESYISVIDLMPTFLKLAGAEDLPSGVEGINVWPVLSGKDTLQSRDIYIRGHLQESIIRQPWKLVRTRYLEDPAEYELYNLEKDPVENNNLLDQHADIAANLKEALQEQFSKDAEEVNLELTR